MISSEVPVDCPYCGEEFTIIVDPSESEQRYIEDCTVCCRPIRFRVVCEDEEVSLVETERE